MATKLYVGNLSFQTSEQELQKSFAAFGSVQSAQVVKDRYTNESRGFAFVEMSTPAEAQAAISGLNGQVVDGRALVVNESKPRESSGSGGGGSRGGGGGYRDR